MAAEEAAAKATAESRVEIAKKMLKNGIDTKTTSQCTDIPVEELEKLKS